MYFFTHSILMEVALIPVTRFCGFILAGMYPRCGRLPLGTQKTHPSSLLKWQVLDTKVSPQHKGHCWPVTHMYGLLICAVFGTHCIILQKAK